MPLLINDMNRVVRLSRWPLRLTLGKNPHRPKGFTSILRRLVRSLISREVKREDHVDDAGNAYRLQECLEGSHHGLQDENLIVLIFVSGAVFNLPTKLPVHITAKQILQVLKSLDPCVYRSSLLL